MDDSAPGRPGQSANSRGRRRRGRRRGKGTPGADQPARPAAPSSRGPAQPARSGAPPRGGRRSAPQDRPRQYQRRPPARAAAPPAPAQPGQYTDVEGSRSVPRGQLPQNLVYGINPIAVALDHQLLRTLFYDSSRQSERLQQLHALASDANIEIRPLQRQAWTRVLPSELHQGVAGILHEPQRYFIEEIVEQAGEDSAVLVLDRVQDPQNLGAVLRTAAATGVDAVVLPKAGGCPLTPAVHKASAGMSLIVPVVEDENLARALEFLKEHGYWVIGCDSAEGEDATTFEFPRRRVIVMGNEAEGMRRLVRENCDYTVRIPMVPGVESLNISVATAVVLYLAKADLARAEYEDNGD